jgi:flagellar hook-length control protein FliK
MKTTEPAATIRTPEQVLHNAAAASPPGPLPFQRVLRDYPAQRSEGTAAPPEASLKRQPDAHPRAERRSRNEPGRPPNESQPAGPTQDANPSTDGPIHCASSAECRDQERIHEDQETVDDVTGAAAQPAAVVAIAVPGLIADGAEIALTEQTELDALEDAQAGSAKSGIAAELPNLELPTADLAGFVPAAGEPSDRSETSAGELPAATAGLVTVTDGQTPAIAASVPLAPSDEEPPADDLASAIEGMPQAAEAAATDGQPPSSPGESDPSGNEQPVADGLAIDAAETPARPGAEPREGSPAPGSVAASVTAAEPPAVRGAPFPTGSAREREASRAADPIELDPVRLLHRVARALYVAEQRGRELTLRLSPPELGSLRLELRVEGGVMTARLEAETQIARTALIENLPALRERLAEQGVRIDRFDVDLMQQQGQGAGEQGTDWERGRVGQWESGRTAKRHVEAIPPLIPSPPRLLADSANTLNVIV